MRLFKNLKSTNFRHLVSHILVMLVGLNRKTAMDLEIAKYGLKVRTCKAFFILKITFCIDRPGEKSSYLILINLLKTNEKTKKEPQKKVAKKSQFHPLKKMENVRCCT